MHISRMVVGTVIVLLLVVGGVWGYTTRHDDRHMRLQEGLSKDVTEQYALLETMTAIGAEETGSTMVRSQGMDPLNLLRQAIRDTDGANRESAARPQFVPETIDECEGYGIGVEREACQDRFRLASALAAGSTRACSQIVDEERRVACIALVARETALAQQSGAPCFLIGSKEGQQVCIDRVEGQYLAEFGEELCATYTDVEMAVTCREQVDREAYLRTFQRRNILPIYRSAQQAIAESRIDRCPEAWIEDDPGVHSWCRVEIMKQFVRMYPQRREEFCGLLATHSTMMLLDTDTFRKGVRVEQEVCMSVGVSRAGI